MKYRDKCDRLLAENRRLTKQLIELRSSRDIWRQKCRTIEAAFDLSQKLVQHLKTENQLMRSTSPDLFPIPALTLDTHLPVLPAIEYHPIDETKITDQNIGGEDKPTDETANDGPNGGTEAKQNIFNSDLIAIEYENEIRELRDDWELLLLLDTQEVLITREDQVRAENYLIDYDESTEEESEDEQQNEQHMDVGSDSQSAKPSETGPQKCKYCGRKFADGSSLDQHLNLHKSMDKKQIRCAEELCGYQFDSKHDLHRHLKTVHKNHGKPAYSRLKAKFKSSVQPMCNECDIKFETLDDLRSHQKTSHNIKSTFKCKFSGCDKTFEKSSELRAHEVIHRKQKSKIGFKVTPTNTPTKEESNCENKPKSGSNTKDKEKTRPFRCQFEGCDKSFVVKTSLKRHEAKVHSNEILVRNSMQETINIEADSTVPDQSVAVAVPVPVVSDMSTQLQLLELLYAANQKQTEI